VEHFRGQRQTWRGYLRGALKRSQLFYQSPDTRIANIEGVAEHFREQGLNTRGLLEHCFIEGQAA
jgi:hypothetical protein